MKIGLIGAFMHDQIQGLDGGRFESLGGTLYNLAALAVTTAPGDTIVPFTYLSREHLDQLRAGLFARFPAIDQSNLRVCPAGTDSNILVYVTASSRRERMSIVTPPYDEKFLAPVAACDAALVNFITGHEMDIDTFRRLRDIMKGPIYFDVHNLGKVRNDGVPVPGHRFEGWEEWLRNVDMAQANEWEAERLFGIHPKTEEEYRAAVLEFLRVPTLKVGTLTLGGEGCALVWRDGGGRARFARIPATDDVEIVDTTGCGDSFSSGFLAEYLRTRDPLRSAVFAATVSGMNCRVKGLDGLARLTGVRERMQHVYRPLLERIDGGWMGEEIG